MMAFAFGFLLLPICATAAGLVVWASNRRQMLDDGELIRDFLIILTICVLLFWGGSRTDTVRLLLDPQFQLQTEMDAHPVYSVIKSSNPDDYKKLHNFLASQMPHEENLEAAFLKARPMLTEMANERLGWADDESKLVWGRVTVDTLKELQSRDSMLCYRALSSIRLEQQELAQAFSAANTKAFQRAIIKIYESSDPLVRHERQPGYKSVDFHEAALEYNAINEVMIQGFGERVSKLVARREFPEPPIESPEQVCEARILQLEAMLERPQEMASRLIDSVLR